jgi:rhodanese-related sulfurtransferase
MNQLSKEQLDEWQNSGKDFLLIDVRNADERSKYNIGGINISYDAIVSNLNQIPQNKPVVFYCEKGIRSVIAIQRLEQKGYTNLYNLSGGIQQLFKKEK